MDDKGEEARKGSKERKRKEKQTSIASYVMVAIERSAIACLKLSWSLQVSFRMPVFVSELHPADSVRKSHTNGSFTIDWMRSHMQPTAGDYECPIAR